VRKLIALVMVATLLAPAQASAAGTSGDGERLLNASGAPEFVIGMNYEGPADRAWHMWDQFDAGKIDADFGRAASGGINTLRVFVQAPLATDIASGHWDKLDSVVALAEQRGIRLILSLHDYGELNLTTVAATAGKIAEHYRGRPGIVAFDLKNEPRFNDIALAKYPSPPPLQQRALIDQLGERLARDALADYRASDDGRKSVPASLSDDAAWIYANNLLLYREMLSDASNFARDHGFRATTLDYLDDPAGQKWAPLIGAVNATLQAWLAPQVDAVRRADPGRPITVDHVDAVLAKLPANDVLDYQTLHRYPSTGGASVRAALALAKRLQTVHPGKPLVLGEFGYATEAVDPDRAALHESAVMVGLLAQHAAGGIKWMLNDMPEGFNQRERTLGAFRLDGTAKPTVGTLKALHDYLGSTSSGPGDFQVDDDADVGLRYVYRADDALFLGGKTVDAGAARFEASGPAELFVSWSDPSSVRLWASTRMHVTLDLPMLKTTLDVDAGSRVLPASGGAPAARADQGSADYDVNGGHFFTEANGRDNRASGYGVTNADGIPLWDAFQSLGGVDVLGYPVTRRFQLDGFTVQAFQKAVLQWRPDVGGRFNFLNTFDVLHDRGRDDWLETYRQTPRPRDTAPDAGLSWDQVVARHLAMLDEVPPPLKERFLADPSWLDHYGLPVATAEYDNAIVVRAQRATLQYWKDDVPWAARGSVTVANGGDLAKEAGLYPSQAATPENAPR
jgi:hypothetical protein